MRYTPRRLAAPDRELPTTMLELFFDLVFVYVITQLTGLISHDDGPAGYAHAGLVLLITWWMYDGFAWLANNVAPTTTATRLPMLAAMTCFLAMATEVPEAFTSGRWIFAGAYLIVVTIHGFQFVRSSQGGSSRAMLRILPLNYAVCALLVLAAVLPYRLRAWCWLVAVLLLLASVLRRSVRRFTLRIGHFAERHHLLVIIALGETIVAVGATAQGRLTDAAVAGTFVLSMALISALWWVYYGSGDDEAGLHAIDGAPAERQAELAANAYSWTHVLHIAGLVLVAVALHEVIAEPGAGLPIRLAVTLAGGAAIFLLAQAIFRLAVGLPGRRWHLLAALLILATIPLGHNLSGAAQLAAVAFVAILLSIRLSFDLREDSLCTD